MPDFSAKKPGDKSPAKDASWITAVSAAAAAYQNGTAGSKQKNQQAQSVDRSTAKIKNLTGSDLLRGHYVQLGEFELDAKDPRKLWFEGNLYDEELPNRVAIVTNAVLQDKRVDAVLIGMAVAVVDVTDTDHRFAEPVDGEVILTSAASGTIEILDTVTETGEQTCAVLLSSSGGTATIRFARVTTEITEATGPALADWGTGEVKLQDPDTGGVASTSIVVDNMIIETGFVVDCQVQIDMRYDPPRVLNGTCEAVSWT